jgi:hypothetical protein
VFNAGWRAADKVPGARPKPSVPGGGGPAALGARWRNGVETLAVVLRRRPLVGGSQSPGGGAAPAATAELVRSDPQVLQGQKLTAIKGQTRETLPGDQSTQFSILKPA